MFFRNMQDKRKNENNIALPLLGLSIINIISLAFFIRSKRKYAKEMHKKRELNVFEQQEVDNETIKAIKLETDKSRHEMMKIFTILSELLEHGECEKASEFLKKFISDRQILKEQFVYCENRILNYLLNRKIEQCREQQIDVKCFVHGVMDGIEDVDMYILMENLMDNAIEACLLAERRKIDFAVYASEKYIEIEIGNTTKENVLSCNPDFHTTKKDKNMHGYGLQNIKDIVGHYHGKIEYKMKNSNYIVCNVELQKLTICA